MKARDNPFNTERIRLIRYRFQHSGWDELFQRLAELRFRGALVGPEGAGKTTLLEEFEEKLSQFGFRPRLVRLTQFAPRFPRQFWNTFFPSLASRDIILFDGAELLGRFDWLRFKRKSRTAGGLIITAHRPGLLPTLLECNPSIKLLDQIIASLVGPESSHLEPLTASLFERHHGNLRSVLRELYDVYADAPSTP